MKRPTMIAATAAVLLVLGLPLTAHDERLHGTNALTGQITGVSADGFTLKTKTETVKVKYSSKTKFEHGPKAVDQSYVKQGDRAGVVGSKLPSGEWMANEVILGLPAPNEAGAPAKTAEKEIRSQALGNGCMLLVGLVWKQAWHPAGGEDGGEG